MRELIKNNLNKRYKKEQKFKFFGACSIAFALIFLIVFLSTIYAKGHNAFFINKIELEINFIEGISDRALIMNALKDKIGSKDSKIVSENAEFELHDILKESSIFIDNKQKFWFSVSSKVDVYLKYGVGDSFSELQKNTINQLVKNGDIKKFFNTGFFKYADSREPESAGVAASLAGSFLMMIVFLICAFPIAVMCAFYLEEFAPKNKITDLIEVSINNLAAVPSIIYGLLGLTLYLQTMNLPRSSALVGGMTLFMLVLPIVIIATRNTIRTIPQSIKDAALSLGASKVQVVLHHLLPLSIPGIMTGTILAMSRALGETAPLLMIGMVAFIADVPRNFVEPATALPVQIYLWSDSPEIGFASKTAAAIMVLLGFLILFNLLAIILRKKFERKW